MTLLSRSFPPEPFSVYQTALLAHHCGISFIPIVADGSKRPLVKWKRYQEELPTLRDAQQWFSGKEHGIAFVTGAVSRGLEMLDVDSWQVYQQFIERVQQEGLGPLLEKIEHGYTELSPRGVHLYYRCPSVAEGNKKLAQRLITEPPYVLSLIETRGAGGYSIGAPSCGRVHPSGQPYRVQHGSLATIQTMTPEDRSLLLSVARTFDELPAAPEKLTRERFLSQSAHREADEKPLQKRLPGTIFNERATWPDILEPHGWTWVRRIGVEDFWRRPGKSIGISATTNYEGSQYLYVFSTSTLFEPYIGISKFAAYTLLEHHGDFSASAKALAAQGYVEEEPVVSSSFQERT